MKKEVLKPFDIEKAKNGAKIVTREGLEVEILTFNRRYVRCIVALVKHNDIVHDSVFSYKTDGTMFDFAHKHDLMIIEEEEFFKPFDRVLVRDADNEKWSCDLYSHYDNDCEEYNHICVGGGFNQCVLFEGNERLLGTTLKPE